MKTDLDVLEERIKDYWALEFSKTRFPEKIFDAFLMLTHWRAEGWSPSALAHLLHAYLVHFKEIRQR